MARVENREDATIDGAHGCEPIVAPVLPFSLCTGDKNAKHPSQLKCCSLFPSRSQGIWQNLSSRPGAMGSTRLIHTG